RSGAPHRPTARGRRRRGLRPRWAVAPAERPRRPRRLRSRRRPRPLPLGRRSPLASAAQEAEPARPRRRTAPRAAVARHAPRRLELAPGRATPAREGRDGPGPVPREVAAQRVAAPEPGHALPVAAERSWAPPARL